jgi:hypothetical protein
MERIKNKKKINYLNNKDILKEIHKSKSSYCSFVEPEYHQYDIIIDRPDLPLEKSLEIALKPSNIKKAKENRATRLSQETGTKINPKTIPETDLIFRIMTWEHIPMSQKPPRKSQTKKTAKDIIEFDFDDNEDEEIYNDIDNDDNNLVYEKVNFPPFQHFKLDENRNFICVGKSHWIGGMDNGYFSKDHGQITDKLARIFMMLCEKYSMKYNWRGYTYRDEMEASAILQLTCIGLRFNEAKSSNPFSYYTAAVTNSFCRVLNNEKRTQNIRDDILEYHGFTPSITRQLKNL